MVGLNYTPEDVTLVLRTTRCRVGNEIALQDDIETALASAGYEFERERRLGPANRIDFLVKGGIGIECKLKYPKRQIWRQIERYCEVDEIKSVILVSATAMGLPITSNGKPLYYVSVGKALL